MRTRTTHSPSISPWTRRSKRDLSSCRWAFLSGACLLSKAGHRNVQGDGCRDARRRNRSKRCGDERGDQVRGGSGAIKFDIEHRVRAVYGRQLGIAGANGGYSYVALFYRNNRLYQVEGNAFVAGRQAEVDAMRFQQSLDLT